MRQQKAAKIAKNAKNWQNYKQQNFCCERYQPML
jgi:hypothetical protein